jgi:hypothetical protein
MKEYYFLWEIVRDMQQFEAGTKFIPLAPGWVDQVEGVVKNINNNPDGANGKSLFYSKHLTNERYIGKAVNLVGNAIKYEWKLIPAREEEHGQPNKRESGENV